MDTNGREEANRRLTRMYADKFSRGTDRVGLASEAALPGCGRDCLLTY
jgi:hypothetical protein